MGRTIGQPLTRLIRNKEIQVVGKPVKTLQQEFKVVFLVYRIPCSDCSWNYVRETGRCLQTRKKEHEGSLKNYTKGWNTANHARQNNHSIDLNNASEIDKGNHRVRKTFESRHTAKTVTADNSSKPLPRQYSILL